MSTGTVGEEAGRLFEALQQAAAAWSRGAGTADSAGTHHLPETCGVCPVCQAIARLGQARPEVVGHLADATAALAAAVSALTADHATGRTDPADQADHDAAPRPTTERIDITD